MCDPQAHTLTTSWKPTTTPLFVRREWSPVVFRCVLIVDNVRSTRHTALTLPRENPTLQLHYSCVGNDPVVFRCVLIVTMCDSYCYYYYYYCIVDYSIFTIVGFDDVKDLKRSSPSFCCIWQQRRCEWPKIWTRAQCYCGKTYTQLLGGRLLMGFASVLVLGYACQKGRSKPALELCLPWQNKGVFWYTP